jgi:acyl-coenzyme A synthetase/AMP-(fatty) acid ligase
MGNGRRGKMNTSRMKDMLRVGGKNVSTMQVESFLLKHPKRLWKK